MISVIVAGSRSMNDYELLEKTLTEYFERKGISNEEVEIVSGTARGTDSLGEKFAEEYHCTLTKFPADWNRFSKSAGYKRNVQMAEYASKSNGVLFAFWDGVSKGTKHMIDIGNEYQLEVNVVRI